MAFRLPNDSQHHVLVGSNGSGKTRAAVWHLAHRSYTTMPWYIVDFKRDDLIAKIPAVEIRVTDKLKDEPGLYVLRPHPYEQDELADFFLRLWARENNGIYVDEGYMIESAAANKAYKLILTQGRSKHVPSITLSQRPVWINRFVLSESTFYQTFRLNDDRDIKTLQQFMPNEASQPLPPFHSWYYDGGQNTLNIMAPVPGDAEIVALFAPAEPGERPRFRLA